MEQHVASNEALRKATLHLQQLLLRTPGKSSHTALGEAEAIADLAFVEGNPLRELFVTSTPRKEPECPRSPSPTGTIRPKSSKAFFKFGRGRDKSSASSGNSLNVKHTNIDGVSPLFEQCFGPFEDKRPKRKERVSDASPPSSSTGPSKGIPVTSFGSQQKPIRVYEQYSCIVCDAELSSKGVCKRHLEEQHITPRVYECEGCHAYFDAKTEAKKHCSQCGDGEVGWVATKLAKKVYACEYTGNYFLGQGRYTDHLLMLSEQKTARPQPNLNLKLEAILRHAGVRNAALIPLCTQISLSLFGSEDGWKELEWDKDFLRTKITVLEHATFNHDGTLESTRFTGSAPRRRNTESYLTQLFQVGRLPSHSKYLADIKPGAMSIFSTPMPVASAASVTSGQSSVDTPLRMSSPFPRSHSRQTAWSHDGIDQSTTASTPRSVPAGDEVMTAELKSKRHLSDESRAYNPTRTPPGPPELPDHYQYQSDPAVMGQAPQLPPVPTFITPSGSTISLPLRKQEGSRLPREYNMDSLPPHHAIYQMHPTSSSHTLTSDGASETSTLAQSYREPEFSEQAVPIDYNLWAQQQLALQAGHPIYPYGNFDYSMADDASMVASSINTGHTIGVEYVTEIPKMESYSEMDLSHHPPGGTFYLHDDGEERGDEMR